MSKKLLSVGVTLALVAAVLAGVAVSTASAQSMSLCQTVDALVAAGVIAPDKVAAAKAAAGCSSTAMTSGYTFTKDLTIGSTGADVTALQNALIGMGYSIPAGATGYFGTQTQAAVIAYQTAKGIAPAAGYVGPLTRASLNYVAPVVVPPTTTPSTPSLSGTEGDVKSFTVLASPSNEDISEGETVKVFGFEIEASDDSDLALKRLDVHFDQDSSNSDSPWDAFDEVSLLQGSKEIASADVGNRSDWSEENKSNKIYRVRFSNIDSSAVIKAGTKVKFYVQVTAKNSIDESDFASSADFAVNIPQNGVRLVDGLGIDIYAPSSASSAKNVDVTDLLSADVTVSEANDNPDSRTVVVDEDTETTDVVLLTAEIESEDDTIVLNTLRIYATSTSISVYDLVSDLRVVIDGEEFSGDINSTASTSTYYEFDIDGDVTIDEDSTVDVKVLADINKNATGTLAVALYGNTTSVDAESDNTGDDVTSVAGTAEGNTVTFALVGVDVSLSKKSIAVTAVDSDTNDYSTATLEVKITNNSKETLYVPLTATTTAAASTTVGIYFAPLSTVGTSTLVVDQVTSLTEQSNSVKLAKGQSATIEVIVTYLPGVALTNQRYELSKVRFSEAAGSVDQVYTAPDTSSYRTSTVTIVN